MTVKDISEMYPEALLCDGFDDAIIGFALRFDVNVVAYSFDKVIKILIERDGMSYE